MNKFKQRILFCPFVWLGHHLNLVTQLSDLPLEAGMTTAQTLEGRSRIVVLLFVPSEVAYKPVVVDSHFLGGRCHLFSGVSYMSMTTTSRQPNKRQNQYQQSATFGWL